MNGLDKSSPGSTPSPTKGENYAAAFCGLALVIMEIWALFWGEGDKMLWIVGLAGIALGLVIGILTSPKAETETTEFSVYAKIGSGFLTGFVVSKADRLFDILLAESPTHNSLILNGVVQMRLIFVSACFFFALITMFTGRRYGLK